MAVHGRAPGAGGAALTPLPPELWAQLGPPLAHLGAISEAIARRHAPDSLREAAQRQPLSATLRWVALLLRRLEESLEDLDPETVVRKFGPFPEAGETEPMAAQVAAMEAELRTAQAALEAWRTAGPTPRQAE